MSKPNAIIIPSEHFYLPWGVLQNHEWIAANIRRFNSFSIKPDLNGCPPTPLGPRWAWTLKFANGDISVRFSELSVLEAKKAKTYNSTVQFYYSDGLSEDELSGAEIPSQITCLAKATTLFPAPFMPLEILGQQASHNLGLTFDQELPDNEFSKLFPEPGQRKLCWLQPVVTKSYPKYGQPALIFHSHHILPALNAAQEEIVESLWRINQQAFEKHGRHIWPPRLLDQMKKAAESDTAHILGGAVNLLLEHVDPDLLISLLPWEDRASVSNEIGGWQLFFRETLTSLVYDRNGLGREFARLEDYRAKRSAKRGLSAPTLEELDKIELLTWPESRPDDEHKVQPLLADYFLKETNWSAAVNELADAQSKIVRRALETARAFVQAGQSAHAIIALTVDELGSQLRQQCLNQLRHPRKLRRLMEEQRDREDRMWCWQAQEREPKPAPKKKAERKKKAKKETNKIYRERGAYFPEDLALLDRDLATMEPISPKITALRFALRRFYKKLREKDENVPRGLGPEHDSFITNLRRRRYAFEKARDEALHIISENSDCPHLWQEEE